MITSAGTIPDELCVNLIHNINRKLEENSLIKYMNPISVEQTQVSIPIEKAPYKVNWGGEIIEKIETVKNEIVKHTFTMKKMYTNLKFSYETMERTGNIIFQHIEQKVITSMSREENNVIINGNKERGEPHGLVHNEKCKTITSNKISDLLIQMFTNESNTIFSHSDITDYIWITTSEFLTQILNDNIKEQHNLIHQFKNEYKLMGLPIKIIDKIDKEKINIILVNLKTNYMFLRKEDTLQMKKTEHPTYVEFFFYKSIDGASVYSEGLVFGNINQ